MPWNSIPGKYKSSSARRCGKIDARVFERFSDLFSLTLSHDQLDIINPIQAGGGHNAPPPPTGFCLAVLKRLAVS